MRFAKRKAKKGLKMSIVYIEIPPDVVLTDPATGEEIPGADGRVSFGDLLQKIKDNPKWIQTYKLIKTADRIGKAYLEAMAVVDGPHIMALSEADHEPFKEAVENPKFLTIGLRGSEVQAGLGYHPRVICQLLPLLDCIMEPLKEDPRIKKLTEKKDDPGVSEEPASKVA